MPAARTYHTRRRTSRSDETRLRIMTAVRDLLSEGTYHESTMEEVADRAGIARATLYQHFRSRLELVDAICDTFAANPALLELRQTVELADVNAAVAETIANAVRFWSSEDAILRQLYGVAAIDAAAQDLVDRQRADRRGEMTRLVRHLRDHGRLRPERDDAGALAILLVLTSYETYRELRLYDMADAAIIDHIREIARSLLLS